MSDNIDYSEKYMQLVAKLPLNQLLKEDLEFLNTIAPIYQFTFQELRKLIEIFTDFSMWQAGELKQHWGELGEGNYKQLKKKKIANIEATWNDLKVQRKSYQEFVVPKVEKIFSLNFEQSDKKQGDAILGKCPVASEKTLCCNLQTLDAVNNCGFECSYCSIQSFFPHNTIIYEKNILEKLSNLKLDPEKVYHIGTGQSSDSMLWGNKEGVLSELIEYAKRNPNVIIEFKTKSKNISFFLRNTIPKNIICTWSLNTQTIIDNEEHHTASLEERINSARTLADKGILVGFHFHPIVIYDNYEREYEDIAKMIKKTFLPKEIAMISLGTLTFTKPVLKEIRKKKIYSKILQMPLTEAAGKLSYPLELKNEMFKHVYDSFKDWHDQDVFFYLCMENRDSWLKVFGFAYPSNEDFEFHMKKSYLNKIKNISL